MRGFHVTGLCLLAVVGCGRGCGCGSEKAKPLRDSGRVAPPKADPTPPSLPSFGKPNASGVKRFTAPRGQEISGLSASPDGKQLVAVSGQAVYVFDSSLASARSVDLPGSLSVDASVVSLSETRAAVFYALPTSLPSWRLLTVDTEKAKLIADATWDGETLFAAALGNGRLAVVTTLGLSLFEEQERLAEFPLPAVPRRLERSEDGSWIAIACEGGVVTLDVSGDAPVLKKLGNLGKVVSARVALPVGPSLLVVGDGSDGRPVASVVSRAEDGAPPRLDLGIGTALGAARSADGSRALVFVNTGEKKGTGTPRKTFLFDTATWAPVGVIAGGPTLPSGRSVSTEAGVVVAACHESLLLDPHGATSTVQRSFPSPQLGPCIDGIVAVGEAFAAREGRQVLTWSAR